ncbi:MAG: hypothetical protein JWP60_2457 [Ramlibacter sp.]|nr:hypothetical protein [Ramlibacter sp.]
MQGIPLGHSGLMSSRIGLGTGEIGGSMCASFPAAGRQARPVFSRPARALT